MKFYFIAYFINFIKCNFCIFRFARLHINGAVLASFRKMLDEDKNKFRENTRADYGWKVLEVLKLEDELLKLPL